MISIPDRDFSWLQLAKSSPDLPILSMFQSLIGILVGCNDSQEMMRGMGGLFQSLIGILVGCNLVSVAEILIFIVFQFLIGILVGCNRPALE